MSELTRRDVLKGGGAALSLGWLPAAAPAEPSSSRWPNRRQLLRRGEPEVYSGDDLKFIGMPVGGLFAGTVYLSGDGQLWNWDVFNEGHFGCVPRESTVFMGDTLDAMGGANYVDPVRPRSRFHQQWRLLSGDREVRFGDVRFRGEYPVARIHMGEADHDVEISVEAFSPFVPLDVDASSFPATTLTFRIKNVGNTAGRYVLEYASENPVLLTSKAKRTDFEWSTTKGSARFGWTARPRSKAVSARPPKVFADWSDGAYGGWTADGDAFGAAPRRVRDLPSYMGNVRAGGEYVVNSHETRHGENVEGGDAHTGHLTSPEVQLEYPYINLRVGGGRHPGKTCVNLIVGGHVVRSVTGRDSNTMAWEAMDVREFQGQTARLVVVDEETGPWGNISLGEVIFSEERHDVGALEAAPDFGSFAAEFLGGTGEVSIDSHRGVVRLNVSLAPGETQERTLAVAWHFPNCAASLPGKRNWYASRWPNAAAVLDDLAHRWTDLQAKTRAWNRTWYDSTLPYWFLDRTFANTSILATTTAHRLDEGRFYFWEGVGCCAGTCTHVYGYAQAIGRVFPEVERYLRREIDFGRHYHPETGGIDYRGEFGGDVAVDGQTSCILRAYREHQMSPDRSFLTKIWPNVKGAMRRIMQQDPHGEGLLTGPQYNTLDTSWYGQIAWISSLYLAALRACDAMASEMGDAAFATECRTRADHGATNMVRNLFNGEYFVNRTDPAHPETNNTNVGCHIDQMYGQSWAHQVGLPRILPAKETKKALASMFKYSFFEDVWEYRRRNKAIPGGRWYATPKEAGLIMCSFPHGGAENAAGKGGDAWAVGYFNECMSGFEYQVAAHMIAEGMLQEGLSIVYAIHQRYHPRKRNPYNEIECSDHYGRAMASYGAFVAMTGFVNDGPRHKMRFQPKVEGEFRCAFLNEKGWGTYHRAVDGTETVAYHHEI